MAREDGSDKSDILRFKVQEMHVLNSFYTNINNTEYEGNQTIKIPQHIKNENLIEHNINSF